jgi:hypothetical protein
MLVGPLAAQRLDQGRFPVVDVADEPDIHLRLIVR